MSKLILDEVCDFDLKQTFECGQCFRWNKELDGSYTGIAYGKVINVSQRAKGMEIDNITPLDFESIWRNYFDLDTDYASIKNALSKNDEVIGRAIKHGSGIRILRQEFFETLISFIISANNNIPRIKGCIENLASDFGEKIGNYKGKMRYAFPKAEVIAELTPDDLSACRLGYRAKYIIEASRQYMALGDEKIRALTSGVTESDEVLAEVMKFSGVGPKVANCILLFSLNKRDSFPIDVWIKRVMAKLYGFDERDIAGMRQFASKTFGEYAGIAQQYLFYSMREERSE